MYKYTYNYLFINKIYLLNPFMARNVYRAKINNLDFFLGFPTTLFPAAAFP